MKMFEDIGNKIKIIGKLITILGIGISIIVSIILFSLSSNNSKSLIDVSEIYSNVAWIVLIGGPILSIINGFLVCGFGELVDKTSKIEYILHNKRNPIGNTNKPATNLTPKQQTVQRMQNMIDEQ